MPLRRFHFNRALRHFRRYRHITAVMVKYGLEDVADVVRTRYRRRKRRLAGVVSEEGVSKYPSSRAMRFRLALEELGPTFVKFGQLLSTRPDLIPYDYIQELERLQDQVAPEESERIFVEIEKQLGAGIEDIFSSFNREPIAAGSIAQVYRARLIDGREAVVKARRPGIVETIRTECEILEDLAGLLNATLLEHEAIDSQRIVREFSETVAKEVDLANERRNQLRFSRNFKEDPTIHVPEVYEEYCSPGVLTMEYIEGIKPNNVEALKEAGLDCGLIAKRGADFVLKQIFEMGFFHADPHPGNFFVLSDNVLAPMDFGQVAHLSVDDVRLLREMISAIIEKNASQMIRALQRAEMINERTRVDKLMRETELMLDTYHDLPLKDIPVGKIIVQMFELIRRHHIHPPAQLALMLKSLMTIESFALGLDSEFNIVNSLKPYARHFTFPIFDTREMLRNMRSAFQDAGDLATRLPDDVNAILNKFRRGDFQLKVHHEHLENLAKTLDKSSNRISFALIIAALLVGSSLLVPKEGMVLGVIDLQTLGIIGFVAAAILGLWLLMSIIRSRHY